MRLEVTACPSTNKLYANVRGIGRVKTKAYSAWIRTALKELMVQRARPVEPPVSISLFLPETMRGDLDGRCKAALDLLVRAEIIPDDNKKIVRSISMTFHSESNMAIEVEHLEETV